MSTSDKNERQRGFATRAIHAGYDPLDYHGALNPPVFLTSTYAFDTIGTGIDRFKGEAQGYIYSRVGNPTATVLETRLATLEGGEAALATSSAVLPRSPAAHTRMSGSLDRSMCFLSSVTSDAIDL